jgi:hypothetical protein
MTSETSCEQMRDEFLLRVATLFGKAREWTERFDPEARIEEETISIKEEPVAPYQTQVLVINRPNHKTVRLIPKGRWIIGAEGRVDMESDLGTETLIYTSEGAPGIRIDELTENGRILQRPEPRSPSQQEVAEGWFFMQNRQIGLLPTMDASLFRRLLEVLGR